MQNNDFDLARRMSLEGLTDEIKEELRLTYHKLSPEFWECFLWQIELSPSYLKKHLDILAPLCRYMVADWQIPYRMHFSAQMRLTMLEQCLAGIKADELEAKKQGRIWSAMIYLIGAALSSIGAHGAFIFSFLWWVMAFCCMLSLVFAGFNVWLVLKRGGR